MSLSNIIASQFVKATNDDKKQTVESTMYGKTVEYNGRMYVQIDGSDLLTPVSTAASMKDGDRVTVSIKNHVATVTGNLSDPSASSNTVSKQGSKISEFEIIIAHKVTADEISAINAAIENLKVIAARIEDAQIINAEIEKLIAKTANIDHLTATDIEAINANIESIQSAFINSESITTKDLEAANAEIDNLKAYTAEFTYVSTDVLEAIKGNIKTLDAEKLSAKEAAIKYANIDFTNITKAAIEYFYATSGLIKDVTIGDGTITGELVGVTIKGDLIEGGTVVADKLVIKGKDGLYYKLNTDGETIETEQTEYNSLDGKHILAKSITATKISVDDLVAFDATIGGFNISDSAIYSGAKESVNNTTRGIYLDKEGQVAFGDSNNFFKYYKSPDGTYKLEISASNILFGTSGKSVEDAIDDVKKTANSSVKEVHIEYALGDSSTTAPTSGWSSKAPTWVDGKYMWQKTTVILVDGTESASSTTCIAGATGAKGDKGDKGDKGTDGTSVNILGSYSSEAELNSAHPTGNEGDGYLVNGDLYVWSASLNKWDNVGSIKGPAGDQGLPGENGIGISSVSTEFYLSTSKTTPTDGRWTDTMPTWSSGMYLWTRSIITYSDNSTETTEPICDSAWEAANDVSNELHQTIVDQNTEITTNYQNAILEALLEYTKTGDLEEFKTNVATELENMSDEIKTNLTTTTEHINSVDADLQEKYATFKNWIDINMETGVMTLGSSENAITLTIENDMIAFRKSGELFGWWDGYDFHTGNIMVKVNERAQFGNFAFVPRSDGSLMFLHVGESVYSTIGNSVIGEATVA